MEKKMKVNVNQKKKTDLNDRANTFSKAMANLNLEMRVICTALELESVNLRNQLHVQMK